MEPTKRTMTSLPPHYLAVQVAGGFALALGLISLLSNLRPLVISIAPWLGIAWIAWGLIGLGLIVIIINGARLIAHVRRVQRSA
jgi:hypothetical protein